mmetsp:Transcript_52150/g.113765  ORF Transcript_52150/g.113765 Transcript_52150/m.113765 type:complete len:204 (+) Transcript_52150:535-1146(+)
MMMLLTERCRHTPDLMDVAALQDFAKEAAPVIVDEGLGGVLEVVDSDLNSVAIKYAVPRHDTWNTVQCNLIKVIESAFMACLTLQPGANCSPHSLHHRQIFHHNLLAISLTDDGIELPHVRHHLRSALLSFSKVQRIGRGPQDFSAVQLAPFEATTAVFMRLLALKKLVDARQALALNDSSQVLVWTCSLAQELRHLHREVVV